MNTTRATRPIPLALTALVAFFSALAALAVSNGMDMAQAHGNAPHHAQAPNGDVNDRPLFAGAVSEGGRFAH